MENKNILIYGANGYTGKQCTKYLIENGLQPVLAGRSASVEKVGEELGCPVRVFDTVDSHHHLKDIDALVNLAGPFEKTQDALIKGCLQTKTHYLDIAGEFEEVKNVYKYAKEAQNSSSVLLSGAGFGVVPTDIAAQLACSIVENPKHLILAYATKGGASRGTLKTVLGNIQKPGVVLSEGQYKEAKPAGEEMEFEVLGESFHGVYNPWRADLFTARLSTGVDSIETYTEFPGIVVRMMKGKLGWLRNIVLKYLIRILPEGPSENQLKKGKTYIKTTAVNEKGDRAVAEIEGPEAYLFTVICIHKMLEMIFKNKISKGFATPSQFGTDWLGKTEGVKIRVNLYQGRTTSDV